MSSALQNDKFAADTVVGAGNRTKNIDFNLPSREERDRAVSEAKECLDAMADEGFQLDGFNLLGVVANPRSGAGSSSSTSHASTAMSVATHEAITRKGEEGKQCAHPISQQKTTNTPKLTSEQQPELSQQQQQSQSGMFSGAVQTFEYTLAQVTDQIETLNLYLEELSRQYLGGDTDESLFLEYYYQHEEDDETSPAHMMRDNVPPELANLELQELQYYLEECGVLAHTLVAQTLNTRTLVDEDVIDEEKLNEQLEDIPSLFYETEFDLTDANTFAELLLRHDDDHSHSEGNANDDNNTRSNKKAAPEIKNSLYQPTQELVPVREQDFLAGHLDGVELALQEQVRQKSTAFFQETTRFRQLQSSIEDLLQQVQYLRSSMQQALAVYQQTKDISDHQRQDYEILIDLLDGSMELVRCKASIGGLLSANDHLGAAQQIQFGRKLLQGESSVDNTTNESESENNNPVMTDDDDNRDHGTGALELQLLTPLSTCGDQFTQYESLVVQNLSEELVEIFFNWGPNERERVQDTVEALQICNAIQKTSELYQRRLQQMIRMTVRTTIAEFMESSSTTNNRATGGVTGMTYPAFYSCLQLLIEEIQSILTMAHRVDDFCESGKIFGEELPDSKQQRWTKEAVAQGSELATKSIAELLRLRKEAHSVISLTEMKQLWDTCISFTMKMEDYSNQSRAVSLRSTLVGQAKAFLDRTHESNMSALVAALDSERWSQCEVSSQRQVALTRLCTGLATVSTPLRNIQENGSDDLGNKDKKPVAVVEGTHYKVVWSCLLLVEMIMTYLSSAAYFQQSLATNAVTKVVELMRLFNTRTTNLVLGAGAIHSTARLKSINAKHLSYVTQCLGMAMSLLPHIRAALMAQLPPKQHALLTDVDNIKNEYKDHNEKVLNKFVSIIGGIVEHGLAPRIASTDFDDRAKNEIAKNSQQDVQCFVYLDGISSSTRKLHHVLNALLPPDHLQDVFSRIFAHLDQQIPALLVAAASTAAFSFPSTDAGKHRFLSEVAHTTKILNELAGVLPWDFTAINVLERKMEYKFPEAAQKNDTLTEALDPTVQLGKIEPFSEVADPKKEDIAENMNELVSIQMIDAPSDIVLEGTEEPLKSNGGENAESDFDTEATSVVSEKGPSSSSENNKSISEKIGNDSLVNNSETCKKPVIIKE